MPIRRLSQLKQEQLAKKYLEQPCLFKTVTGFADKKAWQQVIDDMTNSEIKAQGVKTLFRRERDLSKRYEVRLVSRLGEPARYDVFDAMPENGVGRKRNYEEWKKEMGGELPSYHSWTYANPSNPAFNPVYFGHQHNYPAVVGIRNSLSHKTMDGQVVNHARVKAIFSVDSGTYGRPNAFATIQEAQSYIQSQRNASLLTSYSELEGQTVINRPNETLAGFFWRCDGSSQVVAFRDNLESRLLAQLRALDIQARLDKYPEKYSQSQYGYYSGYKVPVSVWGPGGKGCRLYSQAEQEQDLQAACTGVMKQYQLIIKIIKLLHNPELLNNPSIDVVDLIRSLDNIDGISFAEIDIKVIRMKLTDIGIVKLDGKILPHLVIAYPQKISEFMALVGKVEDVVKRDALIEKILTEKGQYGHSAWLLAREYQPTAIPSLIELVSKIESVAKREALIEKILTEKSLYGHSALLWACEHQPTAIPALMALVSKIEDVAKREALIEKILTVKGQYGYSALLLACQYQPTAIPSLIELVSKIQSVAKRDALIEEILTQKGQYGYSVLLLACRYKPTAIPSLRGLVSKIEDVAKREALIEKMLTEKDQDGYSALLLAYRYQPTAIPSLIELVSKIEDVAKRDALIEKILTEKGQYGHSALLWACRYQPTAKPSLIELVSKIEDVAKREALIEKMLTEKDQDGYSALLWACRYQPTAIPSLRGLVSKIEDVAKRDALIAKLLTEKQNDGYSALLLACRYQPTAIPSLIELVSKVENAAKRDALIEKILTEKGQYGYSALFLAYQCQPTAIPSLIELVSKVEDIAKREALIEKLLTEKEKNGYSALFLACQYQPTTIPSLIELVSKIEDVAKRDALIETMLTEKNSYGYSAFFLASKHTLTAVPLLIELGSKVDDSHARGKLLKEMSEQLTEDQIKSVLSNKAMIRQIAALPVESEFPVFFSLLKTEADRFLQADEKQMQASTKDFMRTLSIQQELREIVDNKDLSPQQKIIAILEKYKDEGGLLSGRSKTRKVKKILADIRPNQSLGELMLIVRTNLSGLDMTLGQHLYSYKLLIDAIAKQAREDYPPAALLPGTSGVLASRVSDGGEESDFEFVNQKSADKTALPGQTAAAGVATAQQAPTAAGPGGPKH